MNKFLLAIAAFTAMSSTAFACDITKAQGAPQSNDHNQLISLCRLGYHAMYNPATKTPRWVAEELVEENLKGTVKRKDNFDPDPDLPKAVRAELSDYVGARTENGGVIARGHMAPAGNFRRNAEAMDQSFYLSNMVPQVQRCNNSGVWSKIEDMTRDWAVHYKGLYVVTGPIYNGDEGSIGNGVKMPSSIFKVILNPTLNQSLAFVVPNIELCGSKPRQFVVGQDQLEAMTGLKFFPNFSGYQRGTTIWQ